VHPRRCGRLACRGQDEETAIQSPDGGTKITWGGPPVAPETGTDRLRFEPALPVGADRNAQLDHLLAFGATRTGSPGGEDGRTMPLDPDGDEFAARTRRWACCGRSPRQPRVR
jgi:hypothetical protein